MSKTLVRQVRLQNKAGFGHPAESHHRIVEVEKDADPPNDGSHIITTEPAPADAKPHGWKKVEE